MQVAKGGSTERRQELVLEAPDEAAKKQHPALRVAAVVNGSLMRDRAWAYRQQIVVSIATVHVLRPPGRASIMGTSSQAQVKRPQPATHTVQVKQWTNTRREEAEAATADGRLLTIPVCPDAGNKPQQQGKPTAARKNYGSRHRSWNHAVHR